MTLKPHGVREGRYSHVKYDGSSLNQKINNENPKGLKHEMKVKFRVSTISCFRGFFARFHLLSNPFAALRAVFKIRIERLAATPARPGRASLRSSIIRTKSPSGLRTAVAHNKGLALFDSEYGDKKQAEVVIDALRIGLIQSAQRASARILIQNLFFG